MNAYYFRSESGDECLALSEKDYANVYDFMKHEFDAEYQAWIDEGYDEEDIPYAAYAKATEKDPFKWC